MYIYIYLCIYIHTYICPHSVTCTHAYMSVHLYRLLCVHCVQVYTTITICSVCVMDFSGVAVQEVLMIRECLEPKTQGVGRL